MKLMKNKERKSVGLPRNISPWIWFDLDAESPQSPNPGNMDSSKSRNRKKKVTFGDYEDGSRFQE